ncbi:MAG: hypothetical protein ABUS47_06625 [Steroidobacter sp.]
MATFLGRDGRTCVGLRRWAEASRMAVNTLRKHEAKALELGWIIAESTTGPRAARFKTWRACTLPDSIELSATDIELAASLNGASNESVSVHVDTDSDDHASETHSVSSHVDTDAAMITDGTALDSITNTSPTESVSNCERETLHLYQQKANLYQSEDQSVSTRVIRKGSLKEYHEVLRKEEVTKTLTNPLRESKKTQNQSFDAILDKIEKIALLSKTFNPANTKEISRLTGCTERQVIVGIKQLTDRGRLPINRARPYEA